VRDHCDRHGDQDLPAYRAGPPQSGEAGAQYSSARQGQFAFQLLAVRQYDVRHGRLRHPHRQGGRRRRPGHEQLLHEPRHPEHRARTGIRPAPGRLHAKEPLSAAPSRGDDRGRRGDRRAGAHARGRQRLLRQRIGCRLRPRPQPAGADPDRVPRHLRSARAALGLSADVRHVRQRGDRLSPLISYIFGSLTRLP